MTEDDSRIPTDNSADHWQQIVDQRWRDFCGLHRFLDDNRDQILHPHIFLIRSVGQSAIRRHVPDCKSILLGLKPLAQPPPTAAWAGILRQACHEMREMIERYYPERFREYSENKRGPSR